MTLADLMQLGQLDPALKPYLDGEEQHPVEIDVAFRTAGGIVPLGRVIGLLITPPDRETEGKDAKRSIGPARLTLFVREPKYAKYPEPVPEGTVEVTPIPAAVMPPPPLTAFDGTWPDPERDPGINTRGSKPKAPGFNEGGRGD